MMKQRNVPHWFWGKEVTIAAYVLNRCPTRRIKKKVWSRKKSSYQENGILVIQNCSSWDSIKAKDIMKYDMII